MWCGESGRGVLQLVIVVALIVIGTAVLVRIVPGDPAQAILGMQATPETLAALRGQLGLDQPLVFAGLESARWAPDGRLRDVDDVEPAGVPHGR